MIRTILLLLLSSCIFCKPDCRGQSKGKSVNETIEWSNTWMVNTNDSDLPRILLIGDSHVEAYYRSVADELKPVAYCCKFTTSRSLGDPILIDQLELIFKQFDFDVICFNNGLHGSAYSAEEYGTYLPAVFDLLKKHSRKSLLWINTTASRKSGNSKEFTPFNDQVIIRNKLVSEFTGRHGIPLIDFNSLSLNHPEYYSEDGIHFNQAGIAAEAHLIEEKVREALKK
jgi:hypothetical protein